MSAPARAALLAFAVAAVGCVHAPAPYWVTDPGLAGPYPVAQPAVHHCAPHCAPPMTTQQGATAPSGAPDEHVPNAHIAGHEQLTPPASSITAPPAAGAPAAERPAPPPPSLPPQPFHAPIPRINAAAPAMKYANLNPGQCRRELRERKLPFKHEPRAVRNIANAVRIDGELNGVRIISAPSPSPFGLLDCRLALAMDDFTKVLASHGIAQIYIGSMYRKGARIAHRGNKSQHSYGLAMDILSMRHQDGRLMKVERDWHAGIGDASCGPDAVMHDPNPSSILMRNVVCDAARRHIFHHMLTPGSNRAHHDHFHFDIKRDVRYQSVR